MSAWLEFLNSDTSNPSPTRIIFYLRGEKDKFTFPEKIIRKHWDKNKKRVLKAHPKASFINQKLSAVFGLIDSEIQFAETNELDVFEHVCSKLNHYFGNNKNVKRRYDIMALYDEFINYKKNQLKSSSVTQYKQTKHVIEDFKNTFYHPDIRKIDKQFETDFRNFCFDHRSFAQNTYHKHLTRFKEFMDWVFDRFEDKNVLISQKFRKFSTHKEEPPKFNLWKDELKLFQSAKFDKPYLERANDMFLGMVYFCMHYRDLVEIKTEDVNFNLEKLTFKRTKTEVPQVIPFVDNQYFKPRELAEKYYNKESEYLFPRISNQKLNDFLKEVQKKVEFERFKLTCKVGRKTFVSICEEQLEIPRSKIMPVGGWLKETSYLAYLGKRHDIDLDIYKNL